MGVGVRRRVQGVTHLVALVLRLPQRHLRRADGHEELEAGLPLEVRAWGGPVVSSQGEGWGAGEGWGEGEGWGWGWGWGWS